MSRTRFHVEAISSVVLAGCALIAVIVMLRGSNKSVRTVDNSPPAPVDHWDALVGEGRWIGSPNADIVIVEFADFECPVCGSYERSTLGPFLDDNGSRAALVFRHWPLDYHRLAYPAARASECAAGQGQFPAYHAALMAKQDSLGVKSFREIAAEVGVDDLDRFDVCVAETGPVERIERDKAEALARGGTGTPTIFVNGFRFYRSPTRAQLDSILNGAAAGARGE